MLEHLNEQAAALVMAIECCTVSTRWSNAAASEDLQNDETSIAGAFMIWYLTLFLRLLNYASTR